MFDTLSIFKKPQTSKLSEELDQLSKIYLNPLSNQKIKKAIEFADRAHEGQFRKSGEPFLTHPINVGLILASLKMDADTIIAGLLHDVVEDCDISLSKVRQEFGRNVSLLVNGVTKLLQLDEKMKGSSQAENFQKMALATAEDVRVVIIKLADRLHNLKTIEHLPREKQIKKCKETMELYAPLAHQIGMHKMATELEDISFKTIHPIRNKLILDALKKSDLDKKTLVSKVKNALRKKFKDANLEVKITGREKRIYSIYKKMKKKKSFSNIYDVFGFRIIVQKAEDCYKALGIVHNLFTPITGRFKDYIAVPKMNGYQAIHTSVMTFDAIPLEVQIQTDAMETFASFGIASHGLYKTNVSNDLIQAKTRQLAQRLTEAKNRSATSSEFLENIKSDFKGKEVYVFSPNGRIYSLKAGATPVDYAYAVHSTLGSYCLTCEIDKKLSPLSTVLKSGQTIEIIKSKKKNVNPDWLNFVVTSKAITEIKKDLKSIKISDARAYGKGLLEESLQDSGIDLKEFPNERLKEVFNVLGARSLNQLMVDIGSGKRTSNFVSESFAEALRGKKRNISRVVTELRVGSSKKYGAIKYPECCYPVSGDPSLAVHNESGITIHRSECQNLQSFLNKPGKCSNVLWEKEDGSNFLTSLLITVKNEPGVLADISKLIAGASSNIESVSTKTLDENFVELNIKTSVKDLDHLDLIFAKLKNNKTVTKILRQTS